MDGIRESLNSVMDGQSRMSASNKSRVNVLFVCLGNICRSPMAGAVFKHMVSSNGLADRFDRIESAGTSGWHDGEEPDERTVATCKRHKIPINSTAQTVSLSHFDVFDYILAMDQQNLKNLRAMRPAGTKARVELFGTFGDGKPIADPYYGSGNSGFERCYAQIVQYSEGLLAEIGLPVGKHVIDAES